MAARVIAPVGPFPAELLVGARSALFLFGAGFLGANDAIHALKAGVPGTVVDTDRGKLDEMRLLYPHTWKFVCRDVFADVADRRRRQRRWDVVSADPFTGDTADRCLTLLPDLLALANRALVLTVAAGVSVPCPAGWAAVTMPRTRIAGWVVFTR